MPRIPKETKRQRSRVIQAWLDREDTDEKRVLKALDDMCALKGITTKQAIMQSIICAAKHNGIEVETPYSMSVISQMFRAIIEKIDGMVIAGHMPMAQASELVSVFGGDNIRYEDLDPAARSLAANYVGFQLEDDED